MSPIFRSLRLGLALLAAVAASTPASAQQGAAAESHPAAKIVREYNQCILSEAWEKASNLIEPASMATLRDDYVERAKRPGVMSLDDEKLLLEKFGVKDLEGIKKVEGKKFYTTYHNIVKTQKSVPDELVKRVRDTMKLTILGVVEEKEQQKAHVLVRSKHENGKAFVENLELISLVNEGGKWMVGLNEQTPKIMPLGKAAVKTADPAAKPVSK